MTRSQLRAILELFGIDLPLTSTDLTEAAQQLQDVLDQFDQAIAREDSPTMRRYMESARDKLLNSVAPSFRAMAEDLFGAQAPAVGLKRPPRPEIEEIPTAEKFLSDFDQALGTYLGGLGAALSPAERKFAESTLRSQMVRGYTGELGKIAQGGQSPFLLKEVSLEERGLGPTSPAGQALAGALGQGVTAPTTVTAEQAQQLGAGVPRQFISLPKLAPLDYLAQNFPVEAIRRAFEASPQGAGQFRSAGFESAPRRL